VTLLLAEAGETAAGRLGPTVWGLPSVVWHLLNVAILVGVVVWLARKSIVASMRERRAGIAKGIEEATRLRDEMRAKFAEYEEKMRTIDAKMGGLLEEARRDAEADRQRLVAEAKTLAERVRADAKAMGEQEMARARRELLEEQTALAAELAEQLLKTAVNKEDQVRLANEFLGRLDAGRKEGRA